MDFKDLAGKAGDLLGQHDDKVDGAIDKAAEMAKGRFAGHESQIDGLAAKARDHQFGDASAAPADAPLEQPADQPPADQPPARERRPGR